MDKQRAESYAERQLRATLLEITGGIDMEVARRTIGNAFEALEYSTRICRDRLKNMVGAPQTENISIPELARTVNYLAKSVDEAYRLLQFADGKPDSRPEFGNGFLAALKPDQLEQVSRWVEENKAASQA